MNLKHYTMLGLLSAIASAALLAPSVAQASEQGVEELTRGPVHEAFAASVHNDPEPGMVVKTAPPTLIEEVPPDQRPAGDNVSWIPGYWGWDDESTDFIWISGVWRNMPPGRQWTPGYWGEAESQWQWTSGYWADSASQEVTYLPKPPKSIESGPNVAAPSRNHVWISGSWVTREEHYAWSPGYWESGHQNWGWSPAYYQWTPRGYVFVDGYWDYDVPRRGMVFAPVRFSHDYYDRPNYSYTPLVVIALNVFADHLFVRPRYGHYYFGDYYAPRYQNDGFYASYSYRSGWGGYDPLYAHARWSHRDDSGWEQSRRDNFDYYRSHEDDRPARTWAALQSRPGGKRDNYQFAQTLPKYVSSDKGQRFQAVDAEGRSKISAQNKQVRAIAQERRQMENRPSDKATEGPDKRIQAKREKLIRTPLAGKPAAQLSGGEAPPTRREPRAADRTEGNKPDKKADRIENSGADKDKKGNRGADAATNKDRGDKAPAPDKQGEQGRKANRPEKVEPEKSAEPRQDKKQSAPRETSPKKERNSEPKTEQAPKQKQREQAQPAPNPEPKPERAGPEKTQERQPRKEGAKKRDKDQAPDEPKGG